MDTQQIKNALYQIGQTYPTVLGMLQKPIGTKGHTVGAHWAKVLSEQVAHEEYFLDTVWQIANLQIPLPEPADRLPFLIRELVMRRVNRDMAALEHHVEQKRFRLIQLGEDDARNWPADRVVEAWRKETG